MRKCANILPYMRRPLVIYDFATAPFRISLYLRKNFFFFISAQSSRRTAIIRPFSHTRNKISKEDHAFYWRRNWPHPPSPVSQHISNGGFSPSQTLFSLCPVDCRGCLFQLDRKGDRGDWCGFNDIMPSVAFYTYPQSTVSQVQARLKG